MQGVLEIIWRTERMLAEISGMSRVSAADRAAGPQAIWANISMIRAYHESRGEGEQRDEVITTIFSHPSNAACAKAAGYKVITIYAGRRRLPRPRGAPGRGLAAHRRADDHQPGGHRHLQPAHRRVRASSSHEVGGLRVLRPGQRQRHPRASPGPATRGSTCATSTCTRRSPPRTPAVARAPAPAPSRTSCARSCPAPRRRA